MEYDPMSPIWLQVVNQIKGSIAIGKLGPGEKMPGGRGREPGASGQGAGFSDQWTGDSGQ